MKQSAQQLSPPLQGLSVKVMHGLFLVGMADSPRDQGRNAQLLKERGWIDIPVLYDNGRRAILTLDKGVPGELIFTNTQYLGASSPKWRNLDTKPEKRSDGPSLALSEVGGIGPSRASTSRRPTSGLARAWRRAASRQWRSSPSASGSGWSGRGCGKWMLRSRRACGCRDDTAHAPCSDEPKPYFPFALRQAKTGAWPLRTPQPPSYVRRRPLPILRFNPVTFPRLMPP